MVAADAAVTGMAAIAISAARVRIFFMAFPWTNPALSRGYWNPIAVSFCRQPEVLQIGTLRGFGNTITGP